MMKTLDHYTVATGHNRICPRFEVAGEVIAALKPLLVAGEHTMPQLPGYRVLVSDEGVLAATVIAPTRMPLVTMYVARDEAGLKAKLQSTGANPSRPLSPPAALVDVHSGQLGDAVAWLGDFERCLAWTWLETS